VVRTNQYNVALIALNPNGTKRSIRTDKAN
jgi:hypothetical protein